MRMGKQRLACIFGIQSYQNSWDNFLVYTKHNDHSGRKGLLRIKITA